MRTADVRTQQGRSVIELLAAEVDLSRLTPAARRRVYARLCRGLGLDPDSRPFVPVREGRRVLLTPTDRALHRLAAIYRVYRRIVEGPKVIESESGTLACAVCRATLPDGRTETAGASLPLSVDDAFVRVEDEARRRATLHVLGLSSLGRRPTPPSAGSLPWIARPRVLGPFLEAVARLWLPSEAKTLWLRHRERLASLAPAYQRAAWEALCRRLEQIDRVPGSVEWLERAIAEEDVRTTQALLRCG
jgi:hypothetical protein